MADASFFTLLTQLAHRTADGKVNWQQTPREGEFAVYFRSYSLSMRALSSSTDHTEYIFKLRGPNGETVDELWIMSDQADLYVDVATMYSQARRRALKIDLAFRSMLAEIGMKDVVGEDPPTSAAADAEDDDLPF